MTETPQFKDHFSKASGYAAYRPVYPKSLAYFLAELAPETGLALDVACGTGQLTTLLAEKFTRVIATDASAAQIEKAKPNSKIEYRIANAEDSGLPDNSIDLITVAQAAHWFNLENFYKEVRRVARPKAVLALISYGNSFVEGEGIKEITDHFYFDVLGPYWPKERLDVENGYKNFDFPFKEIKAPEMDMVADWNMEELIGYLDTWSAVREAEKTLGREPINNLRTDLARVWGAPETKRIVRWPLNFRIGYVS